MNPDCVSTKSPLTNVKSLGFYIKLKTQGIKATIATALTELGYSKRNYSMQTLIRCDETIITQAMSSSVEP